MVMDGIKIVTENRSQKTAPSENRSTHFHRTGPDKLSNRGVLVEIFKALSSEKIQLKKYKEKPEAISDLITHILHQTSPN